MKLSDYSTVRDLLDTRRALMDIYLAAGNSSLVDIRIGGNLVPHALKLECITVMENWYKPQIKQIDEQLQALGVDIKS